ncbi:putative histone lysine methyltransferase, SET [Toxoplasma gondii ARI]|uniref:Putative histone lysine methyltransferase, SET n=1 Tax=Toxoplasma gondii ARI TaxID=1074872 RepID=A0A139XQN7_TOXGO|nr:putative histone lysine methyltransferase, SET [Toxoplasma gondii ARI]
MRNEEPSPSASAPAGEGDRRRGNLPCESVSEPENCIRDSQGHQRDRTECEEEKVETPFSSVEIAFVNHLVGRGLLARRSFKKGEVICNDAEPLVAAQHIYSERCSWTCERCFTFLGNLRDQAELILSNDPSDGVKRSRRIQENLELLTDDFLQREGLCLARPIPCDRKCGVVYCSEEHKKLGQTEGPHRLLCLEATKRMQRAWRVFASHSRKFSENFLLAGRAYAQILVHVLYGQKSVEEATTPFCGFFCRRWEELGAGEVPREEAGEPRELRSLSGRRQTLEESFSLLCRVFLAPDVLGESAWTPANGACGEERRQLLQEKWRKLFSLDFYSELLGTFELVNVDIEFDSPLNARVASALSLRPCKALLRLVKKVVACEDVIDAESLEAGARGALDRDSNSEDMEEWKTLVEDLLPPFLGVGLFRAVSMTNHSCWPNAEVDYPFLTNAAQVTALRDIAEKEEILLSYIDESLPLAERQRLLKSHYKFTCGCQRCQVEAAATLLARRGALPTEKAGALDAIAGATGLSPSLVDEVLSFSSACSNSEEPHAAESVSGIPS